MRNKEYLYESVKTAPPEEKDRSFLQYGEYFKGYSEYEIPRKDGKGTVVRRIYTGKYHAAALPGARWLGLRILYVLLVLGAGGLLIASAALANELGSGYWTPIVQTLAGIAGWFCAWLLLTLLEFLSAGKKLTVYGFSLRQRVEKRSRWSMYAVGAYACGVLLLGAVFGGFGTALLALLLSATSAGLLYAIRYTETHLSYEVIESDEEIPQGARKIDPLGNKRLADLEEYPKE